jgi:uncharacterized membrane protein YhaH (DUF805 family)
LKQNNNIYNYKSPKSGNEETGFLNVKGRISRKAFLLRLLFCAGLYVLFDFGFSEGLFGYYNSRSYIFFETVFLYLFPLFVLIFILLQGAKRMHDINLSGWYIFIPVYNIYLAFLPGTNGNNDYGIDPSASKTIQYFDEIESNIQDSNVNELTSESSKTGLEKWNEHLKEVRKRHPLKTYQEVFEIARNTYNSSQSEEKKSSKFYNNYPLLIFFFYSL